MLRLELHVLFKHVRTTHTHTCTQLSLRHVLLQPRSKDKVHIQAHLQRHVTHAWWTMQSTYTACWCRRKTPTLTNDVLCHAILLSDSSLGESAVYAGGHRTICVYVCVFLCVSKAAAIWEIDGRGRMETMSCGVFLLSALFSVSSISLFSHPLLIFLSTKAETNSQFLHLSLPTTTTPSFLPLSCSFSLSFIHLGIQQQSLSQAPPNPLRAG